jgi:hypothetical protein
MAASTKTTTVTKDRRKSGNTTSKAGVIRASSTTPEQPTAKRPSLSVTLRVEPRKLRAIIDPASLKKEDAPIKEDVRESPAGSANVLPAATNGAALENPSDSNPATPATETPVPTPMGPPTEGPKKKGVKRAANGTGEPKARGRPGPKKKQRLEDGTIVDAKPNGTAAHKLGPKANQGAINAGLRALDRSGKPCRKWTKSGGFQMKSFTGVVWEIPRWTAPPKPKPEVPSEDSTTAASAESNGKENKENGATKSDNSNNGNAMEVDTPSAVPSPATANSPAPAPFAIAAA